MMWKVNKITFVPMSIWRKPGTNTWKMTTTMASRCLLIASSTSTVSLKRGDQVLNIVFRSKEDR